jgi:hypothetical protein
MQISNQTPYLFPNHLHLPRNKIKEINSSQPDNSIFPSIPNEKSFPDKIDLDDKLFAHEVFEFGASRSSFEGEVFCKTLRRFLQVIHNLPINFLDSSHLLFSDCATLSNQIRSFVGTNAKKSIEGLTDFSKNLSLEIQNMRPGTRKLLPGGWVGHPTGHAMLYCIEKNTNNTYKFIIFNTGNGIEFHPPAIGIKEGIPERRFQTFLTIAEITADKFNFQFIQALLEPQILPLIDPCLQYKSSYIYDNLLNSLKGKYENKLNSSSPFHYSKPQRAGICAMKSIFAAARYFYFEEALKESKFLEDTANQYKLFKFAYHRYSLLEKSSNFFNQETKWSISSYKHISQSKANFARTSLALYARKLLSEQDLNACHSLCNKIEQNLKEKKEANRKKALPVKLTAQLPSFSNAITNIRCDVPANLCFTGSSLSHTTLSNIDFIPKTPDSINPENVSRYLNDWATVNFESVPPELWAASHGLVVEALRKLPIPISAKDSFWKKVPEEHIDVCVSSLFKLARIGIFSFSALSYRLPNTSPSIFIEMHAALSIAMALCRRQAENKLSGFILPFYQLLQFYQSPETILYDPLDQKRLDELINFFCPGLDLRFDLPDPFLKGNQTKTLFTLKDIEERWLRTDAIEISDQTIHKNQEFKYYLQFWNDAAIKNILEGKHLNNASLAKQMHHVYKTNSLNQPLFPKNILYLRNLAYVVQLGNPLFGYVGASERLCDDLIFSDEGLPKKENKLRFSFFSNTIHSTFSKVFQRRRSNISNNIKDKLCGADQNQFMSRLKTENEREEAIQQTNAHDEIIRHLAYLETQSESILETKNNQQLLLCHLFRPGRLLRMINEEPETIEKILALLNRRLDYFISNSKWEVALFLIDICNRCSDYVRFAQTANPSKRINISLRNYREMLLKNFLLTKIDICVRIQAVIILQGFLLSKQKNDDSDEFEDSLIDLLSAKMMHSLNVNLISLPHATKSFKDSMKMYEGIFENELRKILDNPDSKKRNTILNGVVNQVLGQETFLEWKGQFPIYQAGDLRVDLRENSIQKGDKFTGILPDLLRKFPHYNSLFSNIKNINRIQSSTGNFKEVLYVIEDDHGRTEVQWRKSPESDNPENDNNETLKIFRFIEGIRYQFCTGDDLGLHLFVDLIDNKSLVWIADDLNSKKTSCHLIIQSNNQKTYEAKVEKKDDNNESKYFLVSFSDQKNLNHLLVDPSETEIYKTFCNFENSRKMAFWAHKDQPNVISEIHLFDLNLHFFVSRDELKQERFFSKEITGFYICEDQMGERANEWPKYLILENGKGERKALMRNLDSAYGGLSTFEVSLSGSCPSGEYFVFDLVPIASTLELKPLSEAGALYLFKLHMAAKHFNKAYLNLKNCSPLSLYSSKDRELIFEIISKIPGGEHPSAILNILKMVVLLTRNEFKYSSNSVDLDDPSYIKLGKKSLKLYEMYLNNISNVIYPLSLEEEKNLLRLLLRIKTKSNETKIPLLHTSLLAAKRAILIFHPEKEKFETYPMNSHGRFPEFTKKFSRDCDDLLSLLRQMSSESSKIKKIKPKLPSELSRTFSFKQENFTNCYALAKGGSETDRLALKNALSFVWKSSPHSALLFLISVCESPEKFPEINEMASFIKEIHSPLNDGQEKKILEGMIINSSFYKEIDSSIAKIGFSEEVIDKMKTEDQKKLDQAIEALENDLPLPAKPVASTFDVIPLPEKLGEEDQKWDETLQSLKTQFSLNDAATSDIKNSLSLSLENAKQQVVEQKLEIIRLANQVKPKASAKEALEKAGRIKKKKLSLDDILSLFEKGDFPSYRQATSLSNTQILELEKKISTHLLTVTRLAQFKRLLVLLNERETVVEKAWIDEKIIAELESHRNYLWMGKDEVLKRSYLIFEYRYEILLRKKQVDALDDIVNLNSSLELMIELGTGSGKSKVLAPLLQRLRQKFGNFVLNIWPSALYEVNKRDTQRQVARAFDQQADTFEFNRETPITSHHLIFILRELFSAGIEKKQMNATPESLQACELKFLEVLYNQTHGKTAPQKSISLFKEILKFIDSSEMHIDEAHINLSPRREVNFTVGAPQITSFEEVELIQEMFDVLITNPEIDEILDLKNKSHRIISHETYLQKIAPALANHFIPYLQITKQDQNTFRNYILGLNTDMAWLNRQKQSKLIILLREFVLVILEDIVQKKVNVNFGLSRLENGPEYAKPYSGNDSPIERANYENVSETFGKTYLTYLYCGLSADHLWKLIQRLQTESLKVSKEQMIETQQTEAYQFYLQHFPDMGNLFVLGKDDINKHLPCLKYNKNLIFYYILYLVSPTIQNYMTKIKSTAANLQSMCQSYLGMTATPGNKEIYSRSIGLKEDPGHKEMILKKIEEKCADPGTMHIAPSAKAEDVLKKVKNLFTSGTDFKMLIDIRALLTGTSNLEVAQALLSNCNEHTPQIKGIVFFDQDDRLMVLMKDRSEPIPYEECNLSSHERLTYCDQTHSFGADIPQCERAKALCTFDGLADEDEMVQGVGRMRQFLQKQSIEWLLTKETKNTIKKEGKITIKDLLDHAKCNQRKREKEDLKRALKRQMSNELRSVMMKKLIHSKADQETLNLFKDFETILVEMVGELNGEAIGLEPTVKNLQNYRLNLLDKLDRVKMLTTTEKNNLKKFLENYESRINELAPLLAEFTSTRNTELETESEIQQNVEVDTETNIQQLTEKNQVLYKRKPTLWQKDFTFYDHEWMKSQFIPPPPKINIKAYLTKKVGVIALGAVLSLSVLGLTVLKIMNFSIVQIWMISSVISFAGLAMVGVAFAIYKCVKWIKSLINITQPLIARQNAKMILYDAGELLREHPESSIAKAHAFFLKSEKGQILFTNNFVMRDSVEHVAVLPLSEEQKSAYEVLVVRDELKNGDKKWTVIVGDQSTDAAFWREELQLDCTRTSAEEAAKRERKVCLYDLNLRLVKNGALPFDEAKELNENVDFQSLITKIKIYNGDVNYSSVQQKCLESLVSTKESFIRLKQFYERALQIHPVKQTAYFSSWIGKFFQALPSTSTN